MRRKDTSARRLYTATELRALPTLATGQADDLKVDAEGFRVWLSRCGPDDYPTGGYPGPVSYETRDSSGRWHDCDPCDV